MNILLVSATLFEIRPLLNHLQLVKLHNEQWSTYQFKNVMVDVLIPGVGMIPTAHYLGRQLALKHYDVAINAGIAGTFNSDIELGTVVNVIEDCVPELGAEQNQEIISVFELGLTDPDSSPYKNGRLNNLIPLNDAFHEHEQISGLPRVTAITSNTVHGTIDSIERIRRLSKADLESMEGAAFFYCCLAENVPCVQVRAVSNRVEERDKSRWKLNLALKNLNEVLWRFIASQAIAN